MTRGTLHIEDMERRDADTPEETNMINLITTTETGTPAGFELAHIDIRAAFDTINPGWTFPFQSYRMASDEVPAGVHFTRVHNGFMQVIERRADGDWSGFTHNFPMAWFK